MTVAGPTPFADATPPLVGRDRELATLREHLGAALAGRGSLVLLGGEAGIGKTALAEAIGAEAAGRGALVLVGRCYDLTETPPYGPWTEARAQFPPIPDLPPLPSALHSAAHGPQQFFAEVRAFFAAAAARQPLVLLLDDMQWADPASLDLLRFLARSLAMQPLLLVVNYRTDDLDGHHPFSQLIPLLVRESRAERLNLAPLSAAALHSLARARYRLGPADEGRLVTYLTRRAEGNTLFTHEMLRALEEQGVVAPGGETLGDLEGVAVPSLLRQIVAGRVARLGAEAERLFGIAAVIGQQVPLDVWALVGEVDEGTVEAVAEQGLGARLLVETRGGAGVAFAHALIREALYEEVPAMRRRRIHHAAGEALVAGNDPAPDAVAYHFRAAGDARATAWLARAGWRAYRAFAYATARARFEEALPQLEGTERARSLLALATLDRYRARGIQYAEQALGAAHAAGDAMLVAVIQFRLGVTLCYHGRIGEAARALEAAGDFLDAQPDGTIPDLYGLRGLSFPRRSRADFRAFVLAYGGQWREARALLAGAPVAANGTGVIWYTCVFLGQLADARRAAATNVSSFVTLADDLGVLAMHIIEGCTLLLPFLLDDQDARQRYNAEMARATRRVEEALGAVPPHLNRCPLLIVAGQWAEARALWAQRHDAALTTDLAWNLPFVGGMARAQGEREEAWALVQEGLPAGPHTAPGTAHFIALDLQCLAAQLALDDGEPAQARQWLEAHDRWLAWAGPEARWGRAQGHLAWAEYHRAAGSTEPARRHAEQALAEASTPHQPLGLLAARRLLGTLATEGGRFEVAAGHLRASLALADACAAPYERVLTLLAAAELHTATGDDAAAQRVLTEARALCAPLDAQPTLARAERLAQRLLPRGQAPASYPAGLSAREAEVLRLIAAGLGNPEIADALSLSVRTVERHVENLYRKIDVHGRAEATAYAFHRGLT
ncbi:MAG: hypothetical protein AVDCRST_MAG88-2191 [uncultured Thermomicrobiales bacterium]|uniref:HTH luxR-type domain-containing protein n=1 Tax=uncultured Thermomicrobiales bacterium TaxID=1645740 RepID=A0A6J4V7B4_9BACT|nr:MAG: hypothetical protein AVDCRST_MAG88-2191 [uncultured Thermomicrobiales bacterium]